MAEHPLQRQVASTLRLELAPPGRVSRFGVVWWSIDIADYGGEVPGTRVARGVVAGIPDTFLIWRGLAHLIELKADDGSLSDPQRSIVAAVLAAGGRVGVARDATETLSCLDQWQIPRNHRVRIAA